MPVMSTFQNFLEYFLRTLARRSLSGQFGLVSSCPDGARFVELSCCQGRRACSVQVRAASWQIPDTPEHRRLEGTGMGEG